MTTVLCVTNDFPPVIGGIQTYVYDYCTGLADRGVQVHVLASTPRGVNELDSYADFDQRQPFTVHRYPRSILLPTPGVSAEMERLIRALNVDVVWFGAAAPLGLMAPAARRAGVRKVIGSTHGHEVGWLTVPGAGRIIERIGAACDTVTYISEYTRQRLSRHVPAKTLVHLPGLAELPESSPSAPYSHAGTVWVTCVSRLVRRKGQDRLIRALQGVEGVHLNIVGEGPDEAYLKRLAQKLGTSVTFWGRLDDAQVTDVLNSSDIFAMPARTRWGGVDVEGLGIVYLRAQACGLPVIAGDSGGAPETVTADSGIVVHSDSQLRSALELLIGDRQLRENMGRAGRVHVTEHWSPQRWLDRFYGLVSAQDSD